jgi:hypothetical protein
VSQAEASCTRGAPVAQKPNRPPAAFNPPGSSAGDENAPNDSELADVIDAWHSLPPDTRTAILAIVEAAQGR